MLALDFGERRTEEPSSTAVGHGNGKVTDKFTNPITSFETNRTSKRS